MVFSKVDAKSGFWQILISEDSRLLTTFITPFDRFCFNKLPVGISSAPELYQCRRSQILFGLDGVLCHIDDVLIFESTVAEHDTCLETALSRLSAAGVMVNAEKCEFRQNKTKFLGHLMDRDGIHPDPEKKSAILVLKPPSNISKLRRFLGVVIQLRQFLSQLGL